MAPKVTSRSKLKNDVPYGIQGKGVTVNSHGGVSLPQMSQKEKKQLLGGEIGTQFDMYTRLFAAFSGGDVFEIGEWRARDIDLMLRRDGTAKALEQVLTLPVRSTAFSFQGLAGDTGELENIVLPHFASPSEAVASGDEGQNEGPTGSCAPGLRTLIGQMSGACIYRKSFFEKRYVYDEGKDPVKLVDLAWRPPATCEVKRDEHTAKFNGFRQRAWWFYSDPSAGRKNYSRAFGDDFTGYLDIDKQRAYVYIYGTHLSPLTGQSDMDVAFWCFKQKQKLYYLWWTFLENQALPKLAAYGSDQNQADDNASALAEMKSSAVGGFIRPPGGQKLFDLIETNGSGASQFSDAINALDNLQTLSVLAGFLNLPSAAALGRGSYALSESQTQFFLQSRQAMIYEMCESFTRDVVAPLIILNRGPDAKIPRMVAEPLATTDPAQILATFGQLAAAPALRIPDQFVDLLAEKVAAIFDLPAAKVDKMIRDGAKIRAMKSISDSPLGATPEGQEAAKLAATLDATFSVLGAVSAQQQPPGDASQLGGAMGSGGSGF
jgi:hypothetical protein